MFQKLKFNKCSGIVGEVNNNKIRFFLCPQETAVHIQNLIGILFLHLFNLEIRVSI